MVLGSVSSAHREAARLPDCRPECVSRLVAAHPVRGQAELGNYAAYRDYFTEIARSLGITETIGNLRELKRIDNALFVFGQFLKAYHPRFAAKTSGGA